MYFLLPQNDFADKGFLRRPDANMERRFIGHQGYTGHGKRKKDEVFLHIGLFIGFR